MLERDAGDLIEPQTIRLFLQLRQQRGGRVIAHALMLVQPSIGAQAQHVIVDNTRAAEGARQCLPLLGSGVEPKAIGALYMHLHMVYSLSKDSNHTKEEREQALSLPGLKARVSRAN